MAKSKNTLPILQAADYDTIVQAKARIDAILAAIAQSEQCGVSCQQHREQLQWAEQTLEQMRTVLFPGGRPR